MGVTFAFAMPRYSWFRRLVSLLLAVLVLTASVGIKVQRYTCRVSGRSEVSILVPGQATALRGCIEQQATTKPIAKDNCCDLISHLHQLATPAHEVVAKALSNNQLPVIWQPAATTWRPAIPKTTVEKCGPRWFAADSSPPPRGGRRLLSFVCALVV